MAHRQRPMPLEVMTNTFEVTKLPTSRYKQYEVTFTTYDKTPVFDSKKKQLFYHLMDVVDPKFFARRMIFDGRALAFAPMDMGPAHAWTISLGSSSTVEPRKGAVTIRIQATTLPLVDPSHVEDLTKGRQSSQRAIVATNLIQLIVRQGANMHETNNGRAYFTKDGCKNLRGPFELWPGIFQSVRPTLGKMVLNVDTATAVVYKSGRLVDVAMLCLEARDIRQLILADRDPDFKRLEQHLKGLQIKIPAQGSSKEKGRVKKIRGLVSGAGDFLFAKEDGGPQMSVAEYYHQTYHIRISQPRIVGVRLTGKGHPHPQVVPLEVCNVVEGQLYKRKLPDHLVGEMVRFAAVKPQERFGRIMEGVGRHMRSSYLEEAGMQIDKKPIMAKGFKLPEPVLQYSSPVYPKDGKWNVLRNHFFKARELRYWAVINFCSGRVHSRFVDDIIRTIVDCSRNLGMGGHGPLSVTNANPQQNVDQTLHNVMRDIMSQKPSNIREDTVLGSLILLVILPENGGPIKTAIKWWGDHANGIATMCTREQKVLSNVTSSQYWNNVMLKINARLGGTNAIVESPAMAEAFNEPCMIMGADVGHPGVGVQRPSTTSLVYSYDQHGTQYAGILGIQAPRVEMIQNLGQSVAKAVDNFGSLHGRPPSRIFLFRDGLSEGEFDKVATDEIELIKEAFERVWKERNLMKDGKPVAPFPKLTYIVVGKRHHITLYPSPRAPNSGDRTGNCHAGTVVDSDITHPVGNDFYLQSHSAIQGTSRSSHYTVIKDEIYGGKKVDLLQGLAYSLCHVYAKATRSVSIPAPVYYADLLCQRINNHIDPSAQHMLNSDGSTTASGHTPFDLAQWQANFGPVHPRLAKTMFFL